MRARSLGVAVVVFVVVIVIFIAVAFLFVFFLLRLLSKKDINGYRAIRGICVETFQTYSVHAQWYASCRLQKSAFSMPGGLFEQKNYPVRPSRFPLLMLTQRTSLEESLSHLSVAPSGH